MCVIDVHTGLGQSGEDTLLIDATQDDPAYQALAAAFEARGAVGRRRVCCYQIHGGHRPASRGHWLKPKSISLLKNSVPFQRFKCSTHYVKRTAGTTGSADILHKSKTRLLDAFRPDSRIWREAVLRRGLELLDSVCRRTLHAAIKKP